MAKKKESRFPYPLLSFMLRTSRPASLCAMHIYDLSPDVRTLHIVSFLHAYDGRYTLKWVDDQNCLVIFSSLTDLRSALHNLAGGAALLCPVCVCVCLTMLCYHRMLHSPHLRTVQDQGVHRRLSPSAARGEPRRVRSRATVHRQHLQGLSASPCTARQEGTPSLIASVLSSDSVRTFETKAEASA